MRRGLRRSTIRCAGFLVRRAANPVQSVTLTAWRQRVSVHQYKEITDYDCFAPIPSCSCLHSAKPTGQGLDGSYWRVEVCMSTSRLTTTQGHGFCPTEDALESRPLFTVLPGVPMLNAVRILSELLSNLDQSIYAAAMGERVMNAKDAWLAKYTLDAARAVVGSVTESLENSFESEARGS